MNKKGFILIIEILIALLIISFLVFKGLDAYFKKPLADNVTTEILITNGINPSTNSSVLTSTREKVSEINKQITNQAREIEER